jgi:4-hydroxybenzoate polyprenyltransferase
MQNGVKKLAKLIENIEKKDVGINGWILSLTIIVILRIFVESWISKISDPVGILLFINFFSPFLAISLIFILIMKKIIKIGFKPSLNILILGYLLSLFPPMIDFFLSGGKGFSSFYIFDSLPGLVHRFFFFFGDRPDFGITYGVRIQVFLSIIFFFGYSFIKTKKIIKAFLASLFVYAILFVFGTFPSWVAILSKGFSKGFLKVNGVDVAQMFISPFSLFSKEISDGIIAMIIKTSLLYCLILSFLAIGGFFLYQRKKFISLFKNIRFPQVFYHWGLMLIGLSLGAIRNDQNLYPNFFNLAGFLVLAEAVAFSWIASVLINDIFDRKIDSVTNRNRPLVKEDLSLKEYWNIAILLIVSAFLLANLLDPKIAFLLLVYQALAWIYSAEPFRLKRFTYLSTFLSAVASLVILFSGYILSSSNQSLAHLPFLIVVLLLLALTLSLPIKDFKDIEGDKADGVFTVPVVFGESWGKIIVGGGIFISFILSVLLLNEPRLFWWALIFGSISFWIVNKMSATGGSAYGRQKDPDQSRVNYRNIFWWMIGIVSAYGIILVKTIFL